MWQTIRVRLTLWFVGLLVSLLLVFTACITLAEVRNEAVELDEGLRTAARWGEAAAQRPPSAEDFPPASLPDAILCVRLVSRSGRVGRTLANPGGIAGELPVVPGVQTWGSVQLPDGRRLRVLRRPLPDGTRVEAAGVVPDRRELYRLLMSVALAVPPTLTAAVCAALFLAGRALRPMGAITRLARELRAGDLSRRIALDGPRDEIKQLADTFDEMLARLDQAFTAQQRFVSDASHELRTPLTIMRGHAEVALADPAASPAELRACLEVVANELRRLSRLAEDLLTLQRADAGTQHLSPELLDLGALATEIAGDLRPLVPCRSLLSDCTAGVMAGVDPLWFRQLLINLVENAGRHTPPGGTITVTVRPDGRWALLEVQDTGAGIAAEHLPHLFDRFYRVDAERSRAQGGAGLGLAIVAWIVQAHGGTVRVASVPGDGTRFTLTFPSMSPPPLRPS